MKPIPSYIPALNWPYNLIVNSTQSQGKLKFLYQLLSKNYLPKKWEFETFLSVRNHHTVLPKENFFPNRNKQLDIV